MAQNWTWLQLIVLSTLTCAAPTTAFADSVGLAKIGFDLDQLDENGLYGPAEDKRSLDYEFCLPRHDAAAVDAVRRIDPSLSLYPFSRGRVGCRADQILAIGNTHQPNAREVLLELANRQDIERIEQTDWE